MSFSWTSAKFDGKGDVMLWLRKFKATLEVNGVEEALRYKVLASAVHEDVLVQIIEELEYAKLLPPVKERDFTWLERNS